MPDATFVRPSAGRRFHIGDVLSVVTGRVMSRRGWDGVEALLRYMADARACSFEELKTHLDDFRAALLGTYPDLGTFTEADMPPPELAAAWVRRRAREFGDYFEVPRLPADHPLRAPPGA